MTITLGKNTYSSLPVPFGMGAKTKKTMTIKNVYAHELKKGDITFYDASLFSGWKKIEKVLLFKNDRNTNWIKVSFEDGTTNQYRAGSVRPVRLPDLSNTDYHDPYRGMSFY